MKKFFTLLTCLFIFYGLSAQTPCTTNVSPANGSASVSPVPYVTLKWNPVPGASMYYIYLSAKVPPTQLIGSSMTDTFNFTGADYNNIYYWYVVPVDANGTAMGCGANTTSFITSQPPPAPVNDDCEGATDISNSMVINGSTVGATQSQAADRCGGFTGTADDDVWYEFTAKNTGSAVVTLNCGPTFDGVLEIFKGNCGSLAPFACSDAGQQGFTEQVTVNVLKGNTYKVRVYSFGPLLTDQGGFSVGATGSALPIALLSFSGEHSGNTNILSWSTATELNNKGFNVQSSFNGRDFNTISFVASRSGNGNSNTVLNYQYTDENATSASTYYRLMQVDKDGNINYSNVVMIKGDAITALTLNALYPNPAKNRLSVVITSPENKSISLSITDITGKTVQKENYSIINGGNKLDIDIAKLPAGSYFVKAVCSDGCQTATSKFVKE